MLLRAVGPPNIDLPSLPELPGWLGVALKVKNVALCGLVVAAIVLGLAGELRKRR